MGNPKVTYSPEEAARQLGLSKRKTFAFVRAVSGEDRRSIEDWQKQLKKLNLI